MLRTKRQEMITIGSILYKRGLISGFDGNISQLFDDNTIIITASGVHKGFLRHEDLLIIDKDGKVLEGLGTPSSETKMHMEIYQNCSDARAIIHVHGPYSVAASLENEIEIDVSELAEGEMVFSGMIKMVPILKPGSNELAKEAGKVAVNQKAFILRAHGAVAWGENLVEALSLLETMENNLKILALRGLFKN